MRSVGEHFCGNDSTVIPCTLCEHLRVSPSNISFRHRRNFSSKSPKYSPALAEVKLPCSVKKLFPILGSCGSNSAVFHVRKTASPLMRARFQRAVPNLPRAFFLLFASIYLLSFSKEGRKTRNLYKKKFNRKITKFTQIKKSTQTKKLTQKII